MKLPFFGEELQIEINYVVIVSWSVDDGDEKMWIATPHFSFSSLSTRTMTPSIA